MYHPRLYLLLVVLWLTSMLAACGGGGGGGGGGGITPTPTPTTAPGSTTAPTPTPTTTAVTPTPTGGVNIAPVADGQTLVTNENTPVEITLTGSDADGDSLSFSVSADPVNGTLSGVAPALTYTPDTDFSGEDNFSFIVNDGSEDSVAAIVSITVGPLFAIGGTVNGAINSGLTLQNNGGDTLEVAGISFEFPAPLADGSMYDVSVAAHPENQLCSLDNASGSVSAADVDDISVSCRYWRTAMPIESESGNAASPQIAFDSDGDATAVWIQNDGTYDRVWANTYSAGVGWGTAEVISGSTGDAQTPQIAIDHLGNAQAVWTQVGSTYSNLWINRFQPGIGWGTAGFIEFYEGDAANPQIAFDGSGNAIIVWEQDDMPSAPTNPTNIWAIEYSTETSWVTAEKIETSGGSAQVPQIAFDSDGNAIAVWHQYDGSSNFDIQANQWSPDTGWGTPVVIESNEDGNSWSPQIVFDSDDNATVVWVGNDGTRFNVWATPYRPDSGWGAGELIETDNEGDAFDPQIAVDNAGNLIAVWRQIIGARYIIRANAYSSDSGWGAAISIGEEGGNAPQLAFDSDGNAVAVWQSYSIYANTWSPISGWSTATQIENDESGRATNPQIAIDNDGNAIVVWSQSDGSQDNIQVNYFE